MTRDHRARVAETLADRHKVEGGYALVNAMWKTQGGSDAALCARPAARACVAARARSGGDRPRHRQLDSFYRGGYRDWPTQWFKAGDEYLDRGRESLTAARKENG